MRPGLVFVGLFALLMALYVLLAGVIGNFLTFILQAGIVLALLGAALCVRKQRAIHPGDGLSGGANPDSPPSSTREEPEAFSLAG